MSLVTDNTQTVFFNNFRLKRRKYQVNITVKFSRFPSENQGKMEVTTSSI